MKFRYFDFEKSNELHKRWNYNKMYEAMKTNGIRKRTAKVDNGAYLV